FIWVGVCGGRGITMHKYPRISFIIPARHEEHNLPHVLPRIPHFVSEVLLVDGHSTGATVEVARQVYPRIRMHTFRDGWRVFLTIFKENTYHRNQLPTLYPEHHVMHCQYHQNW